MASPTETGYNTPHSYSGGTPMTTPSLPDVILALLLLLLPCLALSRAADDPAALAPAPPAGWSVDGDDGRYDRQTIFDYMDGAGEVYLSFDFRSLFVRNYTREGEEGIVLELYDMGSAAEAYGIFSRSREREETGIGNAFEFRSGYCVFWKGAYFVTLYTLRESEVSNAAVLEMARELSAKIADAGAPPQILSLLPTDNRVPFSERYFHKYTDLNQHYSVADDDILALGPDVEAVLAVYEIDGRHQFLLIIRYPDALRAGKAYTTYREQFMGGVDGAVEVEPGYWSVARLAGRYLIAMYDAADATHANAMLDDIDVQED